MRCCLCARSKHYFASWNISLEGHTFFDTWMVVKHNKLIFNLNITTIDYFNSWRTKYTYVYLFKLYSVLLKRSWTFIYAALLVWFVLFQIRLPSVYLNFVSNEFDVTKRRMFTNWTLFGLIQIDWEKNKKETLRYSVWANYMMCLNFISINTWIRTRVAEIMFIL